MNDPARQAFDRLYGHLNLSSADAAWHVFKSGWDAREHTAPAQCWKCGDMDAQFQAKCTVPACGMREAAPTIQHLPADDTEGGAL